MKDLRQIHEKFAKDLELPVLHLEYLPLGQSDDYKDANLLKQIKNLINDGGHDSVVTVLARIIVATPQSADVERLIKINNLLKTASRINFNLSTENKYLHIYQNMPPMESWDPKKAIVNWLNAKDRREHSNLIQKSTAQKQSYYKGIFAAANEADEEEEEGFVMEEA